VSSRPLGAVIVDDEELARGLVREFLASHPDVRILAECSNGFEAVKAISELSPDIVFLDIQMPKLDGFEVLELIPRETGSGPAVIFVTAYDQYAVRAFEKHAVDYLLKPYDRERFDTALERARHRLRESPGPPQAPAALAAAARGESALKRIVVKDGAKVTVLPIETVEFVKAEDDYVLIRSGGREHLKQQTMASLEAQLDAGRFVRIHRSFLLNIDRLSRLEAESGGAQAAVLQDGTRLPVSRSGAARLRGILQA
jgi:two-component system, LytTR family, response regulator